MGQNPVPARVLLGVMTAGGLSVLAYTILHGQSLHPLQSGVLLMIAVVASRFKVKLPGLTGNMSINLPFMLIATVQLSMFEALVIALASTVAQCFPKGGGKPKAAQVVFNVSTMAVAVGLGYTVLHEGLPARALPTEALSLVLSAGAFFLVQTVPVATIISLTEGGRIARIWSSIFHLSFPYYVLSAGVTSLVTTASYRIGWQIPLLVLPVMFGVHRCYKVYFGRDVSTPERMALAKSASC